jgi:class 3 adenylate cyclase/predicted ATPase
MDIVVWLRSLGLGKYEAVFRENEIDETVLPNLTAEDLKELGVTALGHRRKLLDAIAALRNDASGKAPSVDAATASAAASAHPEDRAERRQVTVMFSDLVGSTALSARMDPEDLREVISTYQKCVAETVQRFGGFLAKYMGDGVLVYFGYPQAHEDDAERAVRAGLELVAAVGALKTHAPLQTRVGIATGLVVVGDLIGSGASQEQTIVGETPNLAARLQGTAEPNSVVVAESTRKLLGNLFELADVGPRELKGISGAVRAWVALRPGSVGSRFDALHASGLTELVGREEELDLLLRRWSRAKTGEGQVVLLSGEPGIGKSRLTAALLERLASERHTRLRYFCSPQHTDSALYPIISQMERAAGFARDDSAQAKLDKLDAVLALASTSIQDATLLAEMLSLPNDARHPPLELTPQQRRQKTLEALTAQLEALSRSNPVLMLFEDLHWIDPTSLEALGRTVDRLRTLEVLLIVTYRPEFEPPWIGRPYITALSLNRLGEREIVAMIDRVAGNKSLPESTRRDIIEHTDGIPLFVEETTKAVLEAVGADGGDHAIDAIRTSSVPVPASLHASLMARLDRLGPAKSVAQLAAVIGREFSHNLLKEVASEPEATVSSALDRLISAGLLFRQGVPPHATYLFNHALVQDAAYQSLLKSRRQLHHARIADVLEAQSSAAVAPELIAYHLTEAGRIAQAIEYWLKAGQRAMQRSAHIEAERHLRLGIALLADLPETTARHHREIALQNALGVCLMPTRGFGNPEVAAAFNRAAEICTRVDDDRGLFIALRGKGQYHMISGDMRTACDDARRILALAEEVNNHDFLIEAHHLGWSALCFAGEFRAAQRHAEEGVSQYERERDHHLTYTYSGHDPGMCARAFGSLSLGQLGYPERALARCREGLALAEVLAHPFTIGIALWAAGILHQLRREPDAMRQIGERMIDYGREKGLRMILPFGKVFRGDAMTQHGDFTEGAAQMREGISELRSIGTLFSLLSLFAGLADACARCGNVDEGLAAVEEGLAMMRTGGEHFSLPEIHRIKGKLLLTGSANDRNAAEAAFSEALSIARAQQAKLLELRASMSLARLWRDQGKVQQARELLAPVYAWFTEGLDTRDLKEAKALLGELA